MGSVVSARTGHQPAGHDEALPRLAIILGRPSGSGCASRVEAPDRVLRMWSLLNTADEELHYVTRPGAAGRLQRQLKAVTAELERSVTRPRDMTAPPIVAPMYLSMGSGHRSGRQRCARQSRSVAGSAGRLVSTVEGLSPGEPVKSPTGLRNGLHCPNDRRRATGAHGRGGRA